VSQKSRSTTKVFTDRIIEHLHSSSSVIQSAGSFSERLDAVYGILDKSFPQTSALASVYGSITSLTDFISRSEIEPLLEVIKKSSANHTEYVTTDFELNKVLKAIYNMVKE